MFCSNCGSQLVDGAKFCSECGAKVARPEPEFRTFAGIDFSEPETAEKTFEAAPAPEEKPVREKVSFDWSNVVDEPHKKEIPDIKSPWGTTGNIDEKELFAEMSNPGGKSRTMSFIDVLKAEKEERERAAADKAIEYTEVLHFDQDLGPFEEIQGVKLAPLYDDVDEPIKSPFDAPEFKEPEPAAEDEPRFEEGPAPLESNDLGEPDESELKLSRETIAQFDEFVKSFEKEAGIAEEPVFEEPAVAEPVFEEPSVSAPKFELPDFLKKIADFGKDDEPEIEETEEEPFQTDEPPVIELEDEPEEEPEAEPEAEVPEEEPVFEEPKYDEAEPAETEDGSMEDLYLELDESETTGKFGTRFDLNKYEEEDDEDEDEEEDEDDGIDEDELFKEMEETAPEKPSMTIAPPADKESEIEALRKRLAELTGVDMYAPEDLEEAADLEDLEDEPEEEPEDILFDEPGDDIFTEPEEEEEESESKPENETFAFEVEITPEVDELFANLEPASKAAIADLAFTPVVTPELDELFDSLKPASAAAEIPAEPAIEEPEPAAEPEPVVEAEPEPVVEAEPEPAVEDLYLQDEPEERPAMPKAPTIRLDGSEPVTEPPAPEFDVEIPEEIITEEVPDLFVEVEEPAAPVIEEVAEAEPVVEEVVEEAVEEPAAEEPAEEKETDALSLEELERDLFGEALDEEVEAEETKKIDKFYTLYRKNEEFQRLLDEEYEKLKHGGGLTEEEKQAVDAVPKMADVEAATKAAAAAPAPAPAPAEPEKPEVPVEKEKAYRQVEDETIYMPKELLDEQMKVDFTQASAVAEPKAPAEVPEDKPKKKEDKKVEVEYEDVEHGSKFLTILAVIIAIILIALLAVILILQIAPDSGAAAWIDSLIESITSNFSMLPPGGGQFLL